MNIFSSDVLSHKPDEKELIGNWEGMLVSDSSISPRSQLFYFNYEDGEIDMRYSFANMLHGRSDVNLEVSIFILYDPTPFHDEIRMVTPDIAVGIWMSEWSTDNALRPIIDDLERYFPVGLSTDDLFKNKISFLQQFYLPGISLPKELGLSFLHIEKNETKGTRFGLLYLLRRISKLA